MFKGETRLPRTGKPQCDAARDYVMAIHAHRRGEISDEVLNMVGERLDLLVEKHGKP